MNTMTLAEIEESRWGAGTSILLFLTDRCPVGCAHCSVDSRPDSPRITDFDLLDRIVAAVAAADYEVVGISGGEPFVERRGLVSSVRTLVAAGKRVVIYTSGFWAVRDTPAAWIREVLDSVSAMVLSTDSFHQESVATERFRNALLATARAGVPVVVQVLDLPGELALVEPICDEVRGLVAGSSIEFSMIQPLPYGRAKGLVPDPVAQPVGSYGACHVARAPVVRYDGSVSLCCNENVLMGGGPSYLRRRLDVDGDIGEQLQGIQREPLLSVVARVGVGALAQHPRAADLAAQPARGICGACWRLMRRLDGVDDPLIAALAGLAAERDS